MTSANRTTLDLVTDDLVAATAARKCHGCGCFQDAVAALEDSDLQGTLAQILAEGRLRFGERRYDCLGCEVCWPADALNRAGEITELPADAGCPVDTPERREGWPSLPGEYHAIGFSRPVAVCTLHSLSLAEELAQTGCPALSIAGSMQTENLGIERLVENVVGNPHIRVLLVCGEDTPGRIGHFPGQSLISLVQRGVDDEGQIEGAVGKRPILKNVDRALVDHFRRQVEVVDHRGVVDVGVLIQAVEDAATVAPGPIEEAPPLERVFRHIPATRADRLILDPAGYVVVFPDRRRGLLVAEHYGKNGVLHAVVEGSTGVKVVATLLREEFVTRTDHAAYIGRELALAERALQEGTSYVQDAAPGDVIETDPQVTMSTCDCDGPGGCS